MRKRDRVPDDDPLVELLRNHYRKGGYAYERYHERPGRWSCACGAEGTVGRDEHVTTLWRRHLAREIRRHLGDLTTTDGNKG